MIDIFAWLVRVKLDDTKLAASLPAGTAGDAAIYTQHIKQVHVIRKVILRQIATLNYVNPFREPAESFGAAEDR